MRKYSFIYFPFPDCLDISRYSSLFNSHLQVCVDRQVLPVASDTVDLMFSKNLAVDHSVLQMLLHKLGKQNLWLRAREVFRRKCHSGLLTAAFTSLLYECDLLKAGSSCASDFGSRCWVWSGSAKVKLVYICVCFRFSECGLLPWSISATWFRGTDCALSTGGGGASSHLWDVHHCQHSSHSSPVRAHPLSHHHSKKVNCEILAYTGSLKTDLTVESDNVQQVSGQSSSERFPAQPTFLAEGNGLDSLASYSCLQQLFRKGSTMHF